MKNKIKKLLLVWCIFCLSLICSACGGNTVQYKDVYYVTYGEWFVLPSAQSVSVKDDVGNDVSIKDGKFYVNKGGEYKIIFNQGKETYESTVIVNVPTPKIIVESEIVYVKVGENIEFPTVKAYDAVGEIDYTAKLYQGDEEIENFDEFTPLEKGTYRYELTATSYGRTTVRNIEVYAEETDAYKNIIASYDKPYGVNQIAFVASNAVSYTTDVKMEGEDGSLRILASPRYHSQGFIESIVQNLNNENIGQYEAIYFYVYNDTDEMYTFYWGWSTPTMLAPKAWTLCMLQKASYNTAIDSLYDSGKNTVSVENFNGMALTFYYPNQQIFVTGEQSFYLSSMYGVKRISATEVQEQINEVLGNEVYSQKKADLAKVNYELLSLKDKEKIVGYADLMNLMNNQYMYSNGIDPEQDKVVYFDRNVGLWQIQELWESSQYQVTNEKTYNGENVLKVTKSGVEWAVRINRPLIYDLSAYKYLTFAVYNGAKETLILDNVSENRMHGLGTEMMIELPAKQWTVINIPLGSVTEIVDAYIWIRHPDWKVMDYEYSLYISPIYASRTPKETVVSEYSVLNEKVKSTLKARMNYTMFVYNKENF